jgi:rRNA-processing protein FCF1
MPVAPLQCVVDSNVIIDCHVGQVMRAVFSLPLSLMATEFLIAELDEPDGHELKRYGLVAYHLSEANIKEIMRLKSLYPGPSIADLSALAAAKTVDAILLTGNKHLRNAATKEGVSVKGTLWLLDELVRLEVLTPLVAAQSLRLMLSRGRRLPRDECKARLIQWGYSGRDQDGL